MRDQPHGDASGMNRRQFLGVAATAGVGATAPLLLPSRLFGAEAPSNRITLGFIGTGRQAHGPQHPGVHGGAGRAGGRRVRRGQLATG